MASNSKVIDRWADVVRGYSTRHLTGRSVLAVENTVYSYGRHFPDGRVFARGSLYHNPVRRQSDHARRRIGDGKAWHEVFTNTVPRFRGQSLAWSGFGRVD